MRSLTPITIIPMPPIPIVPYPPGTPPGGPKSPLGLGYWQISEIDNWLPGRSKVFNTLGANIGVILLGVEQLREPLRRDHHGIVAGPDLDHLPPGRLHPIAARLQRFVNRISADNVARRQTVAHLVLKLEGRKVRI